RPPAGRDLLEHLALDCVDDPPRGVVARDVSDLTVRGAGQLVGTRPNRHPARYGVGSRVEPEEFPLVAARVFNRDEYTVALRRGRQAMRLRPDFYPLDDLVRGGVDDVDVVAEGVGHVQLRGGRAHGVGRGRKRSHKRDGEDDHRKSPMANAKVTGWG